MDLILGTAQLTRPYGILRDTSPSRDSPQSVLHVARDSGFTGLDTAPIYGDAERVIGEANLGIKLHTKIDPELDGVESVLRSRERLGVQRLDVVYQHEVFDGSKEQLETLRRINGEAGDFVADIGVSVYTRREFEMAMDVDVLNAVQIPFNVASSQFKESDFREASSKGKLIYARSLFLQGVLTAQPGQLPPQVAEITEFVQEFQRIASRFEVTPVQAAISYVRAQAGIAGIVVGANTRRNVLEIGQAFKYRVDPRLIDEYRSIRRPRLSVTDPRNW